MNASSALSKAAIGDSLAYAPLIIQFDPVVNEAWL